ncbi:MAG: TraR/DksA family transcriptional regulator [Pseudomonadales bacterium]
MTTTLSEAQLAELESDLMALRNSLESLLESTEAGSKPVKLKDNAGRLTRMDEMHNQSILLANRNVTKNRLAQVKAAVTRINNGTYGYCLSCDEPIALPRLKAYPEAALCIACKSRRE